MSNSYFLVEGIATTTSDGNTTYAIDFWHDGHSIKFQCATEEEMIGVVKAMRACYHTICRVQRTVVSNDFC